MARTSVGVFCILTVCILTISCTKLGPTGPLRWKQVEFADSIPSEYGSLVSVTSDPQNSHWIYLWFQKPDGTITVSFVDVVDGRVNESLSIPRR